MYQVALVGKADTFWMLPVDGSHSHVGGMGVTDCSGVPPTTRTLFRPVLGFLISPHPCKVKPSNGTCSAMRQLRFFQL